MATWEGRGDQERRIDGNDKRPPSWESEQVWQNDIDLLKPSAGLEKLNSFLMFLGALLNLVEGGGGDWWCEADPPQGLPHAATLSCRSLLAFAQAGTGAADRPLISDGQHGNAGGEANTYWEVLKI
ncbi:uncharacterized protein [Aegilops tauschii subsp. strangulata]|uniref:uncharacterized protein isoform X1 n=1 Tax=Aegilops tauschii subsp. strangulata TaxID=200361 RepID=UPI00098A5235|nr:uncharacterized protein LOC109783889 isoform X2 [Aegilops tauschii subsp. strangulata]